MKKVREHGKIAETITLGLERRKKIRPAEGRILSKVLLQHMFRRFVENVIVLKWPIFLGLLLITIVLGLAIVELPIDPSVDTLFSKNSKEYQFYKQYRERYGSDEMLAIAMATDDIFTVRNIEILKTLTDELDQFPHTERVLSLANAIDIKHKFLGVKTVPALTGNLEESRSFQKAKEEILSNELFVHNLISKDGKVANILVFLEKPSKNTSASGIFIEKLKSFLNNLEREDLKFYVAGAPMEQYEFVRLIRRDQLTFVPLITVLLILTTLIIYRSLACVILCMSIVFMTLIWTFGAISVLGQDLNLVTSLLAPVIMIVSVVNAIHLMNLFFEMRPHHKSMKMAMVLTMDQLSVPSFLTHVTTMLGFISLTFTPTPAIQSFGLFAALGTFFSYIIEIVLTPILFPMLPYRIRETKGKEPHFFNRILVDYLERLEFRWKWIILGITVIAILLSIIGIRKIHIDTSLLRQLKPEMPLAIATRYIDENVTGVYSLGFVISRKDGGEFTDYESLMALEDFRRYMQDKPQIVKVNSITTLIKKLNEAKEDEEEAFVIPSDEKLLKRYFEGLKKAEDNEVWNYISKDFKEVRVEGRMKSVGTKEGWDVEQAARLYLKQKYGNYLNYEVTGNVVLLGRMSKQLVEHQMKSFIFAFSSILLLICFIFRSLKMALLAAIPNLFPILGVYGLMGWIGIELSTTTAMISSIVIGLVVDASIHFMHRFRLEFNKRKHYLQSLHHTFRNVGQALFISTLILATGFASSFIAYFRPTVHFGLLTSLTIVLAFLCTLIVLPVCLVILKPFGRQKLFTAN